MADAPAFRHPSPGGSLLRDLVAGYEHITGDAVMRPAKVNLIAACYRVCGDDFLPLVARRFASTGTVVNLLGEIRCMPPERSQTGAREEHSPAEPSEDLQPAEPPRNHLDGSDAEHVPADPDAERCDDRGKWNSDTGTFFTDEDLGIRPSSPTARALAR